jgi:hypothetical protein
MDEGMSNLDNMTDMDTLASEIGTLSASIPWWNRAIVVVMVFAALAALGLVAVQFVAFKKAELLANMQDALSKLKDQAIALELATKDENIARANAIAAEADRKAEEERVARLKLEKELAPRRLSGEQRERLVGELHQYGGSNVAIVSPLLDPEATDFADDLEAAFRVAGWHTARIKNHMTADRGLAVGSVGIAHRKAVVAVRKALSSADVAHKETKVKLGDNTMAPSPEPNVVYLLVRHKPEVGR